MGIVLTAVTASMVSGFSLLIGYVITLSAVGRLKVMYVEKKYYMFMIMFATAVILRLFNLIDYLRLSDIVFGVVLSAFLYMNVLTYSHNYASAILYISMFHIFYSLVRNGILGVSYFEDLEIILLERIDLLRESLRHNNIDEIKNTFQQAFRIYKNYNPAIWSTTMVVGSFVGGLFLSKNNLLKFRISQLRFPEFLKYIVLFSLTAAILPQTKLLGINILLVLGIICSLQGLSVLAHWWTEFFAKSKIVLYLFVIMIFFNFFFIMFVSLIGLLDLWFDFRKFEKKIGGEE